MTSRSILAALAATAWLSACAEPNPPARPAASSPPPLPAAQPVQMPTGDGRVTVLNFQPGVGALPETAGASLGAATERLSANPRSTVVIATYATREGMGLARERARAVRQALMERGIAPNRIRIVNGGMRRGADADAVQVTVR